MSFPSPAPRHEPRRPKGAAATVSPAEACDRNEVQKQACGRRQVNVRLDGHSSNKQGRTGKMEQVMRGIGGGVRPLFHWCHEGGAGAKKSQLFLRMNRASCPHSSKGKRDRHIWSRMNSTKKIISGYWDAAISFA